MLLSLVLVYYGKSFKICKKKNFSFKKRQQLFASQSNWPLYFLIRISILTSSEKTKISSCNVFIEIFIIIISVYECFWLCFIFFFLIGCCCWCCPSQFDTRTKKNCCSRKEKKKFFALLLLKLSHHIRKQSEHVSSCCCFNFRPRCFLCLSSCSFWFKLFQKKLQNHRLKMIMIMMMKVM